MNYEENQTVLQETDDNIDKQVSKEITKQSDVSGAGKSFSLDTIDLNSNIANNIGQEDDYSTVLQIELDNSVGDIPDTSEKTEETKTETKEETKVENSNNEKGEVKYKKLKG